MTDTSDYTPAELARTATAAADAHWQILRKAPTFTTVGRTATGYENGHLVLCERQQLTVFSDGEILFYYHDDLAALQGIVGSGWDRLRDTGSILAVAAQPARTDTIDY